MKDTNVKNRVLDPEKDQTMPRSLATVIGKTVEAAPADAEATPADAEATSFLAETGGPKGPEPTRYGDWERKGRCIDF